MPGNGSGGRAVVTGLWLWQAAALEGGDPGGHRPWRGRSEESNGCGSWQPRLSAVMAGGVAAVVGRPPWLPSAN